MNQTVAQVMTENPVTVKRETSLTEAIKIIAEKRVSGLPVVDNDGKLVGVISETDLMWKETGVEPPPYVMFLDSVIYLENPARYEKEVHKALGQTVGEVMTSKAISITPDQSIKDAARLMHEKHVRRLPVVDEAGVLVGIITRGDIVRSMANIE